mmetsp:Transcript_18680/g.38189  ORF Transcript_18680/g.38189 Transcript_18680/m.38189 type:complete len:249 (-) Transcript_18680:74-820(-)
MVPLLVPHEVALLLRPVLAPPTLVPNDVYPVLRRPMPLHALAEARPVAAALDVARADDVAPLVSVLAVGAERRPDAVLRCPVPVHVPSVARSVGAPRYAADLDDLPLLVDDGDAAWHHRRALVSSGVLNVLQGLVGLHARGVAGLVRAATDTADAHDLALLVPLLPVVLPDLLDPVLGPLVPLHMPRVARLVHAPVDAARLHYRPPHVPLLPVVLDFGDYPVLRRLVLLHVRSAACLEGAAVDAAHSD